MTGQPNQPFDPHDVTPTVKEASPRRQPLSREQAAQIELGRTQVSPAGRWVLTLLFLATIVTPAAWEHVHAWRAYRDQRDAEASAAWRDALPPVYDIVNLSPRFGELARSRSLGDVLAALPDERAIDEFETNLEERALTGEVLLPRVQHLLTAIGRTGNEQAVHGHTPWLGSLDGPPDRSRGERWLFYQPDIDYLTGEPFLDAGRLERMARHASVQADPVEGVLHFHRQLAARGIELVLVPTPVKPTIHPERLSDRYGDDAPLLNNRSFGSFVTRVRDAGVHVFDPGPLLHEAKRDTGRPQYLATDTHWTPEAMQRVAAHLAAELRDAALLPGDLSAIYQRQPAEAAALGDVAVMLKLPDHQRLFAPEPVTIARVVDDAGDAWSATRHAPLLVLGDSFTNVYSRDEMGFGEAAGFVEQLSYELQSPADRIVINAGGAHATRQQLAQNLARGVDRLAGVRVVVWQFAARELLSGDWRLIDLPDVEPAGDDGVEPREGEVLVEATIGDIARPPRPGTVAYRDAVVAVHLVDARAITSDDRDVGPAIDDELLVYVMGMADNRWTNAANWRRGQRVTIRLRPWDDVVERYGSLQLKTLGTDADFLEPWWGEGR
ncbi:MAG: hypothetical protein WD118_11110 [Phycisphaeraceae bacterium]